MNSQFPTPGIEALLLWQSDGSRDSMLQSALSLRPDVAVVAQLDTSQEAVDAVAQLRPHVVIVDLGANAKVAHLVIEAIRLEAPAARILVHAGAADTDDGPGVRRWLAQSIPAVAEPLRRAGLDARLRLADQPRSVPFARTFVAGLLAGCHAENDVEPVGLVTSELVANAVLHVRGRCALELTCEQDVLRVAVADGGPGIPRAQELDPASERGRGLHLVEAFSSRWGVDRLGDGGKVVWAELDRARIGTS